MTSAPLFRPQVMAARQTSLQGDVALAPPVSWQLIGFAALAMVGALGVFLQMATYARVETIAGTIETDLGSPVIVASRAGIVTDVSVSEGSSVRQGDALASLRTEEAGLTSGSGSAAILAALDRQDEQLRAQADAVRGAYAGTGERLAAQLDGQTREVDALATQIAMQNQLVSSARDDTQRMHGLLARGFASRRETQGRDDALASRMQQLSALDQLRSEKVAALAQTRRAIDENRGQAHAATADIEGRRATVARSRAEVEALVGYTLTAPFDGTVTALTARRGQSLGYGAPLMTLVPVGARLQARLYVPSRSLGFLAVGQEVRLALDAFPYAKFGTVASTITAISHATMAGGGGGRQAEPVYLVTAEIPEPWILAFGENRMLQPDMALSARVVTAKRSLFEWLFEPVLAVRRR